MRTRKVERIITPGHLHWVGDAFRMKNVVPFEADMERMDPFIGIEYAEKYYFHPSENSRGAGAHPHRGFETVSIVYKGAVAHNDSTGAGGVIAEGETQWMTAASGVLHKEYLEENFNRTGGDMQMVQLWVNLPSKYKMEAPKYQTITKDKTTRVTLPDNNGTVEVVAGEYENQRGIATTFSPIQLYNVRLKKGGKATFNFPENYNTGMLMIEGSMKVNGEEIVEENLFALFENKGEHIEVEALEDCVILVLSGEPTNEPIVTHGPFVMNSRQEIVQAFEDYNLGRFGYLED